MRANILLRPSMLFFTGAIGVFVAVMLSVALSPNQSSAKVNDCADVEEGLVECTKGGGAHEGDPGGGGGGGNFSKSIAPDGQEGVIEIDQSGGGGYGTGEGTYGGGEGGHGSLTLDEEGNISGSVSGGGGKVRGGSEEEDFRGGGRCTYDYNISDPDYEPECVGKEGFEAPL